MDIAEDIQDPPPQTPPQTPQEPQDNVKKVYEEMSRDYDMGDIDSFRQKMQDSTTRKKVYDALNEKYDVGSPEDFDKHIGVAPAPAHQLQHSSITDVRYLQGQANNDPEMQLGTASGKQSELDPEFAAHKQGLQKQYSDQLSGIAKDWGADPKDVSQVMSDFPGENDETHLKANLQLLKESPVAYTRYKAADENMKLIGGVSVHAANMYNELQGDEAHPVQGIDQLQNNISEQKNIINTTLSGDARDKAMKNLEINRSANFNSLNPDIINGLASSKNTDLDPNQYAGLQTLKEFDPQKYDLYSGILNNTDKATMSPDQKIGMEKIQKELLDIGRNNTINYLSEQQHVLDNQYKSAQTDQDKQGIQEQFLANKSAIEKQMTDSQNESARFPYMKDLEFEKATRDLMGSGELSPANTLLNRFGITATKGMDAVKDAATELLGSDKDVAENRVGALGESESESARNYQPSVAKTDSPIQFQFDKGLEGEAAKIKSDKTLSPDQKYQKLYALVKSNPDQVHTITNNQYGQSANFFSKATIYKSAGMIGDLAGIASQQGLLGSVGIPKLIAAATPMYLTTEHDFYKEGVAKGVANPLEYSQVHAAIMMAAGVINPDLNIAKRSLGLQTELGKTLSGVSEKTWNDVINANKPVLSKIKNSLSSVAKETAKMGTVYGAGTSIASDLANKGLFNEKISGEQMVDHAIRATRDILVSSAPLLGLHAITNFKNVSPQEKARLWDMGDNVKLNTEKIDHLVQTGEISSEVGEQRKQFIKNIGTLVSKVPKEDAKGNPMTDQQRSDYLYRMIMKDRIGKISTDLPEIQKAKLEGEKSLLDMQNGEALVPGSGAKAVASDLADLKFRDGQIQMKGYEGKGPELMKFIQDQVTGRMDDGTVHDLGGPKDAVQSLVDKGIPEHLIEGAIRFMPEEDKRFISEMHLENKTPATEKVQDWLRTKSIEKLPEPVPEKTGSTSVIMPADNKAPNIIAPVKTEKIPFDEFRGKILDEYKNPLDKWSWRISSDLSTKERQKGVQDIQDGKNTAAARKIETHIKEMYDNGTVPMNRGIGSQSESRDIPFKDLGHTMETVNGIERNLHDWLHTESQLTPVDEEFLNNNIDDVIRYHESDSQGENQGSASGNAGQSSPDAGANAGPGTGEKPTEKTGKSGASLSVEPPKPPTETPEAASDAGHQSGTRISKQGVFDQYGVQFEKTRIGWNDITKDALGSLTDDAIKNGTSVAREAERQVNEMRSVMNTRKFAVSEHNIVTAAIHLMNLDASIDEIKTRPAGTPDREMVNGVDLYDLLAKRDSTLELIDKMGSKSGRNLGLFAGVFSRDDDGGVSAHRDMIGAMLNQKLPETLEELEADGSLSNREKAKIRPYVEKLVQIKADYEAGMKAAQEGKQKVTAAQKAKSKKVADKLRDVAKDVRSSAWWERNNLGKPIGGKVQGFTFDVQENLAKAIEHIADGIENLGDLQTLIKEAVAKFKGDNNEKDFEGLVNIVFKQNKDLVTPETVPFDVNSDAVQMAREMQRRKTIGELKSLAQGAEDNASPWWRKVIDYRRSFLIGGIKTLGRVGLSGVSKLTIDPLAGLTTGNIISLLPGLGSRRITPSTAIEGFVGLTRFKNDAAAIEYADQKQAKFEQASRDLAADPNSTEVKTAYLKAEMENAQGEPYRYMHANIWGDTRQLARTGSTDFEQMMGGYAKVDPTILRGATKLMYYLNGITRIHGVEKNPSARRAFIESYNNQLVNFQKKGTPLSASTRMQAMDLAYGDFMSGKYQNSSQASRLVNKLKYGGDKPNAMLIEKVGSAAVKVALPVAKISLNIVKSGWDMSTGGVFGWGKYAYEGYKAKKAFSPEKLAEYKTTWDKLQAVAEAIPEKERIELHKVMSRGLFGLGLMMVAAYGVSHGQIRYNSEYDEEHIAKRKFKGPDGEYSEDLDYGQWEILGHKFGKFGSSVFNHLPEFLPFALIANTHHVYNYEREYEGASGDRKLKSKSGAFWEAMKSNVNEFSDRLPFETLLHPSKIISNFISIPIAKEIGEGVAHIYDTDAKGNLIERKPSDIGQKIAQGVGLYKLVDKKNKGDEFEK